VGYTQSDEISLCLYSNDIKKGVFFDGRKQKLVSVLAGLATIYFYRALVKTMPSKLESFPSFDARAFTLPNLCEAANVFLWREKDALKNSVRETLALSDEQRAKLPKDKQALTPHYERKRVRALECVPLGKMQDKESFLFG